MGRTCLHPYRALFHPPLTYHTCACLRTVWVYWRGARPACRTVCVCWWYAPHTHRFSQWCALRFSHSGLSQCCALSCTCAGVLQGLGSTFASPPSHHGSTGREPAAEPRACSRPADISGISSALPSRYCSHLQHRSHQQKHATPWLLKETARACSSTDTMRHHRRYYCLTKSDAADGAVSPLVR